MRVRMLMACDERKKGEHGKVPTALAGLARKPANSEANVVEFAPASIEPSRFELRPRPHSVLFARPNCSLPIPSDTKK